MWDALTITEAEAAGLSGLAALDLAMARDFAARAQAETDPGIAADLARCYQRMARSYRQSLALKARLAREIAAAERDAPPPPRDEARIRARVDEVRRAARRVIWAEHEPDDSDEADEDVSDIFFHLLEQQLERKARDERFGLAPLDDDVAAVCGALALPGALARRWRDLPDPPGDEPDEEPDRRSSG